MKKEPSKEEYQQIVKNLTPKHNSLLNCTKAFVTGGTFCVLGEVMKQLIKMDWWKDNEAKRMEILKEIEMRKEQLGGVYGEI